jgi:hypothetical protein
MKRYKLDQYIGDTIGGVHIAESGIIAAAHLKGFGSDKHPGVIQFLKSGGTVNGEDAFGTTVGDNAKKFADYDLGCCVHLALTLVDREKAPIHGLTYGIEHLDKVLKRGKTSAKGKVPKFAVSHGISKYDLFVSRIEGGMKHVVSFAAPVNSALPTLMSPSIV